MTPHEFDPGHSGMSTECNQLVVREDTEECGLPRADPTHRIDVPCAECGRPLSVLRRPVPGYEFAHGPCADRPDLLIFERPVA